MKVFIKPLEKLVEVTRMPYVIRHELAQFGVPRGFTVETVDGQVYEVNHIEDMIFIFDGMQEMNLERDRLAAYREKARNYQNAYERFRKELKMTPDEFMKAVPFEKF